MYDTLKLLVLAHVSFKPILHLRDVHQWPAVRLEGIRAKSKSAIPMVSHPLPAFLYRFIRPVAKPQGEAGDHTAKFG